MWLAADKAESISARRRQIAGPTGCGLCGIDSISEAVKPAAVVGPGGAFSFDQIMAAMDALAPLQKINIETRAVHAAAFWTPADGIVALREDVGRHNALDKLAGALAQAKVDASAGHGAADQPRLRRDGAEDRRHWRAVDGVGLGADRAGDPHGGGRRHHAGRHRARGRF